MQSSLNDIAIERTLHMQPVTLSCASGDGIEQQAFTSRSSKQPVTAPSPLNKCTDLSEPPIQTKAMMQWVPRDQVKPSPIVILRLKQVITRTGLSRSTIYSMLDHNAKNHDASFKKPIKLGANAIGFIEAEIESWLASRIAASRSDSNIGGQSK